MTDFMDTALNYQPGDWVARNANHWVITNGTTRLPLCDVCAQPIYEGHIGCTCDKNHPEICNLPTYAELSVAFTETYDELVALREALEEAK